jgi:hypothetical protein
MSDPADVNSLDATIYSLVKEAIVLENYYKDMILQGDEVDRRIQLWRDAVEICKAETEGM